MVDTLEASPESSFNQQFSNKVSLETPTGSKFNCVEIESNTPDIPVLVIPGWSITLNTEKQLLEDFHTGGKHVLSLEFPRHGGEPEAKEDISEEVMRQAEMLVTYIQSRPEDKIDITGQSMAVMSLIAAAKLEPAILYKIRNIVFTSPAGLTGNDNFLKLGSRFLMHLNQDTLTLARSPIEKINLLRTALETSLYIGKNPPRAIKEANSIATSEEYDALQLFKENGIKVGIIQGAQDKLTPAGKLWNKIGEGSQSVWKTLSQEDYDNDPRYKEHGVAVGDKVWDSEVKNEVPPFDSITMVRGGHDNRMYGERGFANRIINRLDALSA